MARIAITGGAGFIGSHLTDLLLSLGHEVVIVDNLFTGRKTNFEHNLDNKNFEFAEMELVDYYIYHIKANQAKLDYLIKLAKAQGITIDRINQMKYENYDEEIG